MQPKQLDNNNKKIDSYSALIFAKYFETEQDFINLICVNSKFKETTEKFRFNPIPIKSLKLLPKIETQHLYKKTDEMIKVEQIIKYELWYCIDYGEYTQYGNNVKCHNVEYTQKNREKYGEEILDNVTLIGDQCFQWRSTLSRIRLPLSLTSLGSYCFKGCSTLSTINLPTSLKSLGDECFSYCSKLSTINLPTSLSSLGKGCFSHCSTLSFINLPTSLKSLGWRCFSECSILSTINLENGIKSLGDGCFSGCSTLSFINLPTSLTSLGNECFLRCSTLSTINLPSTLTSFGKGCFYGCSKLKGVINVPDYCYEKLWWMRVKSLRAHSGAHAPP